MELAGEEKWSPKYTPDGNLEFTVPSVESAMRLLRVDRFLDLPVQAYIPKGDPSLAGRLEDVDPYILDEVLLEELKPQGVVSLKRCVRREEGRVIPRSTVLLAFGTLPLPSSVTLGYIRYPVRPASQPAQRCYQCLRYGHIAARCRSPRACFHCLGKGHIAKDCSNKTPLCRTCGGQHETVSCTRRPPARCVYRTILPQKTDAITPKRPTPMPGANLVPPGTSYKEALLGRPPRPPVSRSDASTQCDAPPEEVSTPSIPEETTPPAPVGVSAAVSCQTTAAGTQTGRVKILPSLSDIVSEEGVNLSPLLPAVTLLLHVLKCMKTKLEEPDEKQMMDYVQDCLKQVFMDSD
jgi:hypothetical protein